MDYIPEILEWIRKNKPNLYPYIKDSIERGDAMYTALLELGFLAGKASKSP